MNIDREEWLYVRGQVNGLMVRADELAGLDAEILACLRRVEGILGELAGRPPAAAPRASSCYSSTGGTATAALRVLEGGGSGGRGRRPVLTVVREAAQ